MSINEKQGDGSRLTDDECLMLADAAIDYHLIMTHPAGTEAMIGKLRDMRRKVCDIFQEEDQEDE